MLASTYFGIDDGVQHFLNACNVVFAGIFTVEAAIKLAALGPRSYFLESWNRWGQHAKQRLLALSFVDCTVAVITPVPVVCHARFDFVVVVGSDIGVAVTYAGAAGIGTIASVARAIRVLRSVSDGVHVVRALPHA